MSSGSQSAFCRVGSANILVASGVRADDSRNKRDWTLTSIWAFAMDGSAAGLVVIVLGSYYMWWQLPQKRVRGLVFLVAGWILCLLFVAGFNLVL